MTRLDAQSPVLLAALAVRLFGVAMLGYAVPLAWHHFPHPLASAAVAAALAAEAGLTAAWWWRRGTIGPATLLVELPTGVVGMLLCALVAVHHAPAGWTGFAYQYSVLMAILLGYAARTLPTALGSGALWGATTVVAAVLVEDQPWATAWPAIPTFLVTPLIGWTTARMLRRGIAELDAARGRAVRQAAELATERERTRHAQALHDRVLQTLETLVRGAAVNEPTLARRIVEDAAWLRRFVETGEADQGHDLSAALALLVRELARDGIEVQLNDAALRMAAADEQALTAPARAALLAAIERAGRAMAGPAGLVVRGETVHNGVLVTVLAADGRPADLDQARAGLHRFGGQLRQDALPYAELWVPAAAGPEPPVVQIASPPETVSRARARSGWCVRPPAG
jgi:hypothetical protein